MLPEGLDARQEACVYVYKVNPKRLAIQSLTKLHLSPFVYLLALKSFTFLVTGVKCYWCDGSVIDDLPEGFLLLWVNPLLKLRQLPPSQNCSCFIANWKRQSKVWELVYEFKSHVYNEKCKVLVAYVHSKANFEAFLAKVFLVITLNVWDMLWTCLDFNAEEYFC